MKIKTYLVATAAVFLAVGAAQAADQTLVSKTTSADGTTTTTTTRTYYYNNYDKNDNGILDSEEFPRYVYSRWDRDGDGFLSDEEWQLSSTRWYPSMSNNQYKTYSYWDKDGDGRLDSTEFNTVMTTTKLYSTWDVDADNVIERDEYAKSTFHVYDSNGDGEISMAEWTEAQ